MRNPSLGPAPSAVTGAPVGLSRARAGVLALLDESGSAMSVTDVASSTGLHPNTAREHLDGLVDVGLAARLRAEPVGRGRPAWLFRAVSHGRTPGAEYAGLATALVEQLARSSGDPRGDALDAGRRWGAELARRVRPSHRPSTAREPDDPAADEATAADRRTVVRVLTDLRFDPHPNPDATEIRLRSCPILDAARAHPEIVCGVHLGIVGGALHASGAGPGQRVNLVPFAEPGACLLTVRP